MALAAWPACRAAPPPSRAADAAPSPSRAAAASPTLPVPPVVREVPVERASNIFFARVVINGRGPFSFTVDTGATLTVIDPAVAAALGLAVEDEGQPRNVGVGSGMTAMRVTRGVTLTVGDAPPFSPPRLFVVPVRANAGALGHAVDGVLGTDFLSGFVVEFDYAAGSVRVHTPSAFAYRGGGSSVPMTVEGNVLLARAVVALEDDKTMWARMLVDTGSSARLSFNSPFVRRHGLTRFPALGLTASVGINGVTAAPVIGLRSLAFGQAVIERPEVALSQASSGLSASDAFDGIIGAELLNRFRMFVDYAAGRLIFELPAAPPRAGR